MRRQVTLTAALLVLAIPAAHPDWPQYLGPQRNGVSPETGLARSWPEGGPQVLWTVPLGKGFGAPDDGGSSQGRRDSSPATRAP